VSLSQNDTALNKSYKHLIVSYSDKLKTLETGFTDDIRVYEIGNPFGAGDDLPLANLSLVNLGSGGIKGLMGEGSDVQALIPSIYHHFTAIPSVGGADLDTISVADAFFCRRETSIQANTAQRNTEMPILQSILNFRSGQLLTQIPLFARPRLSPPLDDKNAVGYIEVVDLAKKCVSYLEISKSGDETEDGFNVVSEANYLMQAGRQSDSVFTIDFDGVIREWETSRLHLERSLDEWHRLVNSAEQRSLNIEYRDLSEDKLKDLNGPKHGKVDLKNAPHVGGNTWAGGSGGRDTAGLGGVGGPYRLDSGNQVFQVCKRFIFNLFLIYNFLPLNIGLLFNCR
jgi:hypothetical protein